MIALLIAAALAGPSAPPDWQAQHAAEHREIARVADGASWLRWVTFGIQAAAAAQNTARAIRGK